MTPEEKQLLLRDLCARLPYGVIGSYSWKNREPYNRELTGCLFDELKSSWDSTGVSHFSPYLRPMSSMTEEEQKEFESIWDNGFGKALDAQISNFDDCVIRNLEITASSNAVDWLNKHGFDYRELIPKYLALSTDEFNPYEN